MTEHNRSVTSESQTESPLCHFVQQRLPDFLHLGLTAVEHQQIQAHLAQCNSCARRVQEARLLDNDLQAEADRYQPRLSRDASLRIQNQVYRRMQRSLVWQRTGQALRLATAAAALILLLGGSFLFGRFWFPFLTAETNTVGETTTLPDLPPPGPTVVTSTSLSPTPTPAPASPRPAPQAAEVESPATMEEAPRNGRVNAWDHWVAAAPGQTPEQLAATVLSAALANDETYLNELFMGMGAAQQPTARMWLSVANRCQHNLSSADFVFARHPIPLLTITSVSIWYDGHLAGEIKMRQVQGEWFATFARPPAVYPCSSQ
ncbi:MAG: zf-HC2 domain-containing protein [Anaerolineaceae bacterium]|nr:zf-HC2 domain-containing protein [Anaerolineaceae bacterium]